VHNFRMKITIMSVKEAAEKFHISDAHCRRLLKEGKIKGKKLGHDWVVRESKYKRKRKPKGGQSSAIDR
jgi:excisionase family DNA binding protein